MNGHRAGAANSKVRSACDARLRDRAGRTVTGTAAHGGNLPLCTMPGADNLSFPRIQLDTHLSKSFPCFAMRPCAYNQQGGILYFINREEPARQFRRATTSGRRL